MNKDPIVTGKCDSNTKRTELLLLISEKALVVFVILLVTMRILFNWYLTDGNSMSPTIEDGDILFGLKFHKELETGDVIIAKQKGYDGLEVSVVKRLIAKEGDIVEIINNKVYVNGEVLDEPYLQEAMITSDISLVVEEGSVFVLGDNRNSSYDSRKAELIKESDIDGLVIFDLSNWRKL